MLILSYELREGGGRVCGNFKVNSNAGDDESIVAVGREGISGREGEIFHFSIIELILSVCLRLCGICWSIYACERRADTQNELSLHVLDVKMFSISRNSICYDNFLFVRLQTESYYCHRCVPRPFFRQLSASSVWKWSEWMGERVEVTEECLYSFFVRLVFKLWKKGSSGEFFSVISSRQASLKHEKADLVQNNEKKGAQTFGSESSRWHDDIPSYYHAI